MRIEILSSDLRKLAQARGEFFVDSAEAAIGKNRDDISTLHFGGGSLHNGIGIGEKAGAAAVALDLLRKRGQIEALVFRNRFGAKHCSHYKFIGESEAPLQIVLQHAPALRVQPRLKD